MDLIYIFSIWLLPVLIAITFHEAAHGYVALCVPKTLSGDDFGFDVSAALLHLFTDGHLRPVPRQEVVEPAHGVAVRHALEDVFEIGERLDVVELCSCDEKVLSPASA